VFPVMCDHHLHIKMSSYPCKMPWISIGIFPVRYENHVRIKSKGILVTDSGGLLEFEMSILLHCLDNRLTDGGEALNF
jgi:hypothetical protein